MSEDHGRAGRSGGRVASLVAALITLRALRAALRRRRGTSPEVEEDPSEREVPGNRTAETLVAGLLAAAGVCAFGFTAAYVTDGTNPQLLGLAIGIALALL